MIDIAKKYLKKGLWVIPVGRDKRPTLPNWTKFQDRPMTNKEVERYFKDASGIGLLCGGGPRVWAIDFDLKYSFDINFMDRIKEKVPNNILKKTLVQKTQSGGYHWIYKIPKSKITGNEKYASRYTTAFEKHEVYLDMYSQPRHRDNALKIALNDKHRVLIESRGGTIDKSGGYILIAPSKGYEFTYGKLSEINEEEYDLLVSVMRSFNEIDEIVQTNDKRYSNNDWEITPFEDYNERGDMIGLLECNGWIIDRQNSRNIRWRRPGSNHSSALQDLNTGIFNCFSTSTALSVDKGYNLSGLFIELECDGDGSEAFKKLISLGYGKIK